VYWFSNKCIRLMFTFYHSLCRRSLIFYGENCLFAILHKGKCKNHQILQMVSITYVTRSLVFCVVFCRSLFVLLSYFFAIMLSFSLRFTDSDYPFGIFKLFLPERLQIALLKIYFNNLTLITFLVLNSSTCLLHIC
jgi:hypothetical protein